MPGRQPWACFRASVEGREAELGDALSVAYL